MRQIRLFIAELFLGAALKSVPKDSTEGKLIIHL